MMVAKKPGALKDDAGFWVTNWDKNNQSWKIIRRVAHSRRAMSTSARWERAPQRTSTVTRSSSRWKRWRACMCWAHVGEANTSKRVSHLHLPFAGLGRIVSAGNKLGTLRILTPICMTHANLRMFGRFPCSFASTYFPSFPSVSHQHLIPSSFVPKTRARSTRDGSWQGW